MTQAGTANLLRSARGVPRLPIAVKRLGLVPYLQACEAMRRFTEGRDGSTGDQLWIVEHTPVYTVGVAGRSEHFPRCGDIPVVRSDRGGQITYHGPGQAIVYTLLDLARRDLSVRALVTLLEQAVIDTLAGRGLRATRTPGAPGVYVEGEKIAALGLRVRRGACYHGVALNVDMDLGPFQAIDPCGYPGLRVTQTSSLGVRAGVEELGDALAANVVRLLEEGHGPRR